MNPGIQHLEAFLAVCEEEGFGRAAERLHLTQPAVSYHIAELERELGVEVFERPRRRIILTPAGRRLHDFAARYFSELETLVGDLASAEADVHEPISVAAAGAIGRFVVFPVLCSEPFRDLRYRLFFRQPDEILEMVETGECDLGFVYETRVTTALQFREAFTEEFVLVRAPGFPEPEPHAEALEAAPFVTYEECDYVFAKWFDRVLGEQPSALRSVSHFERLEEVLAWTRLGRGLTVVPEHAVRGDLECGALVAVEVPGCRCFNTDYAVTRPGHHLRPEVSDLLEALARAE